LGYLFGGLLGGRLYDRLPGHLLLAGVLFAAGAFASLVPFISWLWLMAVVLFLLGFTEGTIDAGGNIMLGWVHGSKVGPFMNGLHFFFGVGALLAPTIFAQVMLLTGHINWAFWIFALIALPVGLYVMRLPSPVAPATPRDESTAPVRRSLVALFVFFFFVYVCAEAGYSNWIYTYAVTLNLSSRTMAAYLTSTFWGSFTLGRLLGVPIATRFKPQVMLYTDMVGCLVSLGVILLWPGSVVALWVGTLGVGFSMASIFPSAMVLAGQRMRLTGGITGLYLMGAGAGGMFLPWFIGQMFERIGPGVTMDIILVVVIVNLGSLVLLTGSRRRGSELGREAA
jgi:FHS family Na+ dependent glucose MFS transporter 1